jgi:hypothetical protein
VTELAPSRVSSARPVALPRKLLVTLDEAASLLSMSRDHLDRHVRPELRVVRSGALRLVRYADLVSWADRHARPTLPEGR